MVRAGGRNGYDSYEHHSLNKRIAFEDAMEHGQGVLRLIPSWVPRSFCVPGRRIKLDPRDYFAYGGERGGIDERWLSSTVRADNGPLTTPDEGLSFVLAPTGRRCRSTRSWPIWVPG